jgi:2,4-dienoyl-CoA reductase-like NADH-dependent reductase (Old Yellow Enzyme family)
MTDTAALFAPLLVKQVTLRNRIVMSPMTRRFSPGGVPTEEVANYYLRRVHGGVGLIITEGVGIDHPVALDDSGNPVMYGPDALAGWKRTVDVVHNEGGVIFPQLWHMGPMRKCGQGPYPNAPSMRPSGLWGPVGDNVVWNLDPGQVRKEGEPTLPMSHREIDEVIEGYVRSAASAKQVGFDGIAIHRSVRSAGEGLCRDSGSRGLDGKIQSGRFRIGRRGARIAERSCVCEQDPQRHAAGGL